LGKDFASAALVKRRQKGRPNEYKTEQILSPHAPEPAGAHDNASLMFALASLGAPGEPDR
jgi:hypothetical protein